MNDTPVVTREVPPVPRSEMIKAFIGDLARPFAIIATSYAAARATIILAHKVGTLTEAAIYIAAVFAGVGALYGAKAWENARAGKHDADVRIAAATNAPVDPPAA